jgi:hypothetical protein
VSGLKASALCGRIWLPFVLPIVLSQPISPLFFQYIFTLCSAAVVSHLPPSLPMPGPYLRRFLAAKDHLLRAVSSGGEELPKFRKELLSLLDDFERAVAQSLVDSDDAQSAQSVATAISVMVNAFNRIELEAECLSTMLEDMALTRE